MSDILLNTTMNNKDDNAQPVSPPSVKYKRRGKTRALGESISGLTKPVFGKRGLADGTIIHNWRLIAGQHLAAHTIPEKITWPAGRKAAGVLHLKVGNSGLAPEIQHLEPLLIEKINGYFGYMAVEKIRLIHGPLPSKPLDHGRGSPRPLEPIEENQLSKELDEIDDPQLRQALEKLGRSVIGRS